MQYGPHADGNYFGYVDDPTGARLECIYTDDMKFMDHINVNNRKIYFTYDPSGHLTKITYPDGKVSEFGYNGDKLAYAKTVDGVTVSYQNRWHEAGNGCDAVRVRSGRTAVHDETERSRLLLHL